MEIHNAIIATLNCRGFRKRMKRLAIYKQIRQLKIDLMLLQETYLKRTDKPQVEKEWGGNVYVIEGTNHSKGLLLILVGKKFMTWIYK